jgi:hypothetical protein
MVISPQFDENFLTVNFRNEGDAYAVTKYIGNWGRLTYSEGLAAVKVGDKWGYIDRAGKYIINPQFNGAFPFAGGLAMVVISRGKFAYINRAGNYVWKPE